MNHDDESIHAQRTYHSHPDPIRAELLSPSDKDWDWILGTLASMNNEHGNGWCSLLRQVREYLIAEQESEDSK